MYKTNDFPAAVRTVQRYLYELYLTAPEKYKRVYIDGVYSYETRAAVEHFQEIFSLEKTGNVDYETFERLYAEYVLARGTRKGNTSYSSQLPIRVGDSGAGVEEIHLLLKELSRYYIDIPHVPRGRYYSEESAEAIDYMRSVFGMNKNGEADGELILRLKSELAARIRISD